MDWSIQEIARLSGTTSRTLRHYDEIGLLAPTRVGANGYRYYDGAALVRLQRILLLRTLGMGLPAIAEVLTHDAKPLAALEHHLHWLRLEQDRLARQIASVEDTISRLEGEEELMAEKMFSGFEHTVHQKEVEERWGQQSYAEGDAWWRAKSDDGKAAFVTQAADLGADWTAAAATGIAAESTEAQVLAARHVAWLAQAPGGRDSDGKLSKDYVAGLGDMYVADPRFGRNYGGQAGAEFVRDALRVYADRVL